MIFDAGNEVSGLMMDGIKWLVEVSLGGKLNLTFTDTFSGAYIMPLKYVLMSNVLVLLLRGVTQYRVIGLDIAENKGKDLVY